MDPKGEAVPAADAGMACSKQTPHILQRSVMRCPADKGDADVLDWQPVMQHVMMQAPGLPPVPTLSVSLWMPLRWLGSSW